MVLLGLINSTLHTLVLNPLFVLVAFVVPALKSFRALEHDDDRLRNEMLMYWALFGVLYVFEGYIQIILLMIGFPTLAYSLLKAASVVVLQKHAKQAFEAIQPHLSKHDEQLDEKLGMAKELSVKAGQQLAAQSVVLTSKLVDASKKVAAQVAALQAAQEKQREKHSGAAEAKPETKKDK
uniref:Receptor expression-enhancing protein n=1 Tax=Eutreptiella gymnastica TaxID=73025 RepID=A0A7S1J753_9EUGL|mmetsp:Transcript_73299/g.129209  ORF Transcript_73299/g.129209 Transcript_73299/m.129209 type:complete len:180 (+) Transcript_73299:34-573(+)